MPDGSVLGRSRHDGCCSEIGLGFRNALSGRSLKPFASFHRIEIASRAAIR